MTESDPTTGDRGREVRAQLLGAANLAQARTSDAVAPDLGALSDDVLWGRIWARPGLDLKVRSLTVVVALIALERYDYAEAHIRGARNVGWTRDEMVEVMMQLVFYTGLPVVHEGIKLVTKVYGDGE
ncbi:MAG: 4-carboxymuconolactone decarboxylase [Pseudonocardiales bacterium]|nr:4-carboxymuconolactone decarboxylase [Pseudonocardiales bacterium]